MKSIEIKLLFMWTTYSISYIDLSTLKLLWQEVQPTFPAVHRICFTGQVVVMHIQVVLKLCEGCVTEEITKCKNRIK